jgi:hypothetical protein
MARAELFTLEGACPSAQLIVVSAVPLDAAVVDQDQTDISYPLKIAATLQGLGELSEVDFRRGRCVERLHLGRRRRLELSKEARSAAYSSDIGHLLLLLRLLREGRRHLLRQ